MGLPAALQNISVFLCKHRGALYLFAFFAFSLISQDRGLANDNANEAMRISNAQTENDILLLDRQLFTDCINLARFNTQFRLQANYHSPQRAWRYPLGQEAGTAAVFANTVDDLDQRAKGLSNLDNISISAQKNGICSSIAGNAIRGSSSAIELAENGLVQLRASRNGFSPHDSVIYVKARLTDAEKLLAQRAQLVESLASNRERNIFELHDRLFRQIFQQLLSQFMKWSIDSRETTWRENTFYALNTAQNFILCTSSILSWNSFSNPQSKSSAIVTSLIGNSISTVNPPFRTMVGVCMRKYQRYHLRKVFAKYKLKSLPEWEAEWQNLKQSIPAEHPAAVESAIGELSFLSRGSKKLDDILDAETTRIQKLRRVAAQQAISGPIIGLTSLTRSIMGAVAYYDYPNQPETRNKLIFAGLISQTTGQGYSLIDTPTAAIMHAIYRKKLAKRGQLPEQILKRRLKTLDTLEAQLQTEHPWTR